MAVTHSDDIRDRVCTLVVEAVDEGSDEANGFLVLQTDADVDVATLAFGNPAFAAVSGGAAIANSMEVDADAAGGTATKFKIVNRNLETVITGTFGTTGADLIGTAATISPGDTVTIEDGDLAYVAMP